MSTGEKTVVISEFGSSLEVLSVTGTLVREGEPIIVFARWVLCSSDDDAN